MELYSALHTGGLLHRSTRQMGYADIQRLEAADREGVIAAFPRSQHAFRRALRSDSQSQIAARLQQEQLQSDVAVTMMLFALT